jgi:threonine dehydratase
MQVNMQNVFEARKRIAPWVRRTPLVQSDWLSRACGGRVSLKLESLQPTHSFKVRGAFNMALSLREAHEQRAEAQSAVAAPLRLVTASTGNHGRAMSYVAQVLGLDCVVFAPASAPAAKLDAIRRAGATLMADARNFDEAESAAMRYAEAQQVMYLSAYNDARIVAATGTISAEIFDDDPLVDTIVVPVGGGGLISGVALAAKAINPGVRVIGVEAANNPSMSTARARGAVADIEMAPTLADALGGNNDPATITFAYMQRFVDDLVLVSEAEIAAAIRDLAGYDHLVAEGGGAVGAAALVAKRIDVSGRRTAVIVSGGNIDRTRLATVLAS